MDYETLLPEVLPYVPGCPDQSCLRAIRNATIELCTRSLVWQVLSEQEQLSKGDDAYEIDPPDEAELVMLMEVYIDGREIRPIAPDQMRFVGVGPWPTSSGPPSSYIESGGTIRFVPLPDVSFKIVTRAAFRPTLDSTAFDDSLYRDWWEAIRSGALSRLQMIPGQSWSDMKTAGVNAALFAKGLGNAKIAANRGRSRAELRIEMPRMV